MSLAVSKGRIEYASNTAFSSHRDHNVRPAFAQPRLSDSEAKQKIQEVAAKVREAYQGNNAGAYAKQFSSDGALVGVTGKTFQGRQQIEQAVEDVMKRVGGIKSFEATADEAHALPDGTIWAIGRATIAGNQTTIKDHWASINVPDGNELHIRMLSLGVDVPPPQPAR
ncbi:MAG: SgcJ/EcaC family oxidoreductase [Acetobacteraceae bacterium]|nr:SgcJ/EcaC family oxidoreductase [Acetobacteraceae bacterium]